MISDGEPLIEDASNATRPRIEAVQRFAGVLIRERYGLVLLLILGAYVLTGVERGPLVDVVVAVLWVFVLLVTLWAPGVPKRVRTIGVVAVGLLILTSLGLAFIEEPAIAQGGGLVLLAIAQTAALVAILSRILQHKVVTLQTVMAGVAAYALIAFISSAVFNAADLLTDTTFLNGVVEQGDYTYFSFVTLTTVGYGDITAASELAKRLVVVEAFVGQVFIIVFVARLVSLWGKERPA